MMVAIYIELFCPIHRIVEKYKIKVIKRYNIRVNEIRPKFREKPKKTLSSLVVGRYVTPQEARDYLMNYYEKIGLLSYVRTMRIIY